MNKLLISAFCILLILACAGKENKKAGAGDIVEGEKIYKRYCIICHGADGKLGLNGAKDITASLLTFDERVEQVKKGKNAMTPFEGILTEDQIKAVTTYSMNFK